MKLLLHLFYFLSSISLSWAYYGPTDQISGLKLGIEQVVFQIESTIYTFAGIQKDQGNDLHNMTMISIDESKTLHVDSEQIKPDGFGCNFCSGFVLNDSFVLILNGISQVPTLPPNETNRQNMGFMYYNPQTNSMNRTSDFKSILGSPLQRQYQSTVMTPDKSSIYIFGGVGSYQNNSVDLPIVRFDLTTWTYTTYANFQMLGGTATMLPSGVVVIAFGSSGLSPQLGGALYNTSSVFLFDTKTNTMTTQAVGGTLPSDRAEATGVLGPDGDCIYYFGGRNFNLIPTMRGQIPVYDNSLTLLIEDAVVVLNTSSWTWTIPTVSGPPGSIRYGAFSVVYTDNTIIVGGGAIGNTYLNDISVLRNLPLRGQSIESAKLQWFTNSDLDNAYAPSYKLSAGAVAGIIVGVIIFAIFVFILLWRFVPFLRRSVIYIQNDIIWKPRSGEPLWAESSRLTIRFILFFLFIAFVVYAIYRAVESPSQLQVEVQNVDTMPVPDIRICSQPYDYSDGQDFSVICQLSNGVDCSDHFYQINMNNSFPHFVTGYGRPNCQLFIPPLSLNFEQNPPAYSNQFADRLSIKVISHNTSISSAFYVTYYAPGYDPNRIKFNLFPENEKLSPTDVVEWETFENLASLIPNTFGASSYTYPTVSYSLERRENLTNSGWNNIGFAYQRTSKLELNQHVGPLIAMPQSAVTAQEVVLYLTVAPNEFRINTTKEIKSSTILSGFAQAGGVFGLFVAIQTLLFGFRPESPWGLVHRWSFGGLRRALANRLTSQFDRLKTPVPIVNPVHNRFSLTPTRSNMFLFETVPFIPTDEEDDTDGARIKRMEERLQLMELLFKSYYINDEVFRHLDEAIKKNAENPRSIENDKVIASDSSSTQTDEEIPMSQAPQNKRDSLTDPPVKSNDFA